MTPTPFIVRYQPEGAKGGRVWQVHQGTNWRSAVEVSILVPTLTQPNGAIVGEGVVTCVARGHLTITP